MTADRERLDEEELIELAKDARDRLQNLIIKLEAYANVPHDTGDRRRATDGEPEE